MKRRSAGSLIGAVVLGSTRWSGAAGSRDETSRLVSLVRLLARPEEVSGQVVMTAGYFALGQDDAALYLHSEDYQACVMPNSVRVVLSAPQRAKWKELHCSHVAVKARFTTDPGSRIQCGALDDVATIDRVPGRVVSR